MSTETASGTIFRKRTTVDELNRLHQGNMVGALGIEILEIGNDHVTGRMPVDARTLQPYGLLHGGASVALAETLGTVAAILSIDEHQMAVGLDINANHLRGARSGWVTGVCRPVHLGRNTQVWQIDIRDDAGKPVCASRLTCSVIDRR